MVLVAFRQVLREAEVSHLRCAQREFQVARCFTRPRSAPLLKHFDIDPILGGHAGFREPAGSVPVPAGRHVGVLSQGRLAAHVPPNQIFAGMMPYKLVIILCMVIMYLWPGMTLWLPNYLYGS